MMFLFLSTPLFFSLFKKIFFELVFDVWRRRRRLLLLLFGSCIIFMFRLICKFVLLICTCDVRRWTCIMREASVRTVEIESSQTSKAEWMEQHDAYRIMGQNKAKKKQIRFNGMLMVRLCRCRWAFNTICTKSTHSLKNHKMRCNDAKSNHVRGGANVFHLLYAKCDKRINHRKNWH